MGVSTKRTEKMKKDISEKINEIYYATVGQKRVKK